MRPVTIPVLPDIRNTTELVTWLRQLALEIENASREGDVADIGESFTETGSLAAEARALEVGTPTLANTNAVLATLLRDLKYRGASR